MRSLYSDPDQGIHPIKEGIENHDTWLGDTAHKADIAYLQARHQCPDAETAFRMQTGVCTYSNDAFDNIVLRPN